MIEAFGGMLAGGSAWKCFLYGELKAGVSGNIFEYGPGGVPESLNRDVLLVRKIGVKEGGVDRVVVELANAVDIPAGLLKEDQSGFRSETELQAEFDKALAAGRTSLVQRFAALLLEVQRRLQVVEITTSTEARFLAVEAPFGVGRAFAGGSVKLRLFAENSLRQDPVQIKFDGRCEVVGTALLTVGSLTRSAALACIVEMDAAASLRVDVDDFNVSLPEFVLPSLDLPSLQEPLRFKGGMSGLAGAFQRLVTKIEAAKIETSFEQDPAPGPGEEARLALRVRPGVAGGIDWAVVLGGFTADDWDDSRIAAKLVRFKATVRQAGSTVVAAFEAMRFARTATLTIIDGTVAARAPLQVQDGQTRLGPLEVSWEGLVAVPSVSTGGESLWADVSFRRLVLRVHDDPTAFLAFAGKLKLSPKGAQVIELDLVEPYPIQLIANAVAAVAREAAPIVKVVFDLAAAAAEQQKDIIVILGKMAAAVARAAVLVAGDIIDSVADLVARTLSGVAELIAAALKALEQLGEEAPNFIVEIRIATDPVELRQVLITLPPVAAPAGATRRPIAGGALGVQVEIESGWQPGLLIDCVSQPGAFLTATHDVSAPGARLAAATISTDLWLTRKEGGTGTTTPVRDADRKSGDRAAKPVLGVSLNLLDSADAGSLILVIAGLSRGKPVFLEWLAGEIADLPLPVASPIKAKTARGAFVLQPITEKFDVSVEFDRDRILPLLGMGEPGKEEASDPKQTFLAKLQNSLSNVLWVKDTRTTADIGRRSAAVDLILGLKAAGVETEVTLKTALDLDNFEVSIEASKLLPIVSRRIEERALGLVWVVEQRKTEERLADKPVEMFQLGFAGGQTGFELNTTNARMELRFDGLSSDGRGVVFDVETFKISAGGLDLKAKVRDAAVQMNGINVPFRFTAGSLEISGGRLVSASIAGRGSLPPKLIGDADCTVALTFGQDASEGIVLQSGKVELDKKGDPVVCHASRFTLTITDLDIAFVKDGGYHFYYLVTGSLRFTPKPGEFESGLLQFLDGVEMNLERTPLSADPRVLLKHISFQKSLNPKKTFNLFNLFTFEIRGFGYHPAAPKFGGDPAVNISGQISFVEIGDVMQPKIDFHGLWIAPPAAGQSLPRIRADGLGVDLNLKGAIKVRGAVLAVDPGTTVEGTELAPPGYDSYGFLGEGELEIPGWGNLAASLGFLELERQDHPGDRRKSFFFYAEKRQMSVEIPAIIWTFYLREVGFGFGFRYTLEALAAADRAPSIPRLISALDDIAKRQGDLHKFSAWRPEAEGDHVTLALKGAMQAYPAGKNWNVEAEEAAQNPFLFDLVAAIRSDFTLFMGLRGWLGTNYVDYLNDKDKLRSNPGLRGYLYISAPHKRLLARAIGDSKGYIGDRIPALARSGGSEPPLRRALRSIDWTATLFIKPGLFHYEMGWPNQLVVRLMDEPNMRVTVRGGMIFRAADDGLLWGYNIEADAFFRFGGSVQIGPVGIAGEATLDAHLVARVICYLSWRIKGSLVYGLIALDASLAVSIRAWMEVDLGIKTFTIRISFSRSLQLSASVEMVISPEGVGAQVHARVAISAFGCTLSVSIGFTLGGAQLAEARARVQRFMAMSITAEEPDAQPLGASRTGDDRIESDARGAEAPAMAPPRDEIVKPGPTAGLPPSQFRAQRGLPIAGSDFWLVLHKAGRTPKGEAAPEGHAYALLVPQEAELAQAGAARAAFYAAPTQFAASSGARSENAPCHRLFFTAVRESEIEKLRSDLGGIAKWMPGTMPPAGEGGTQGTFRELQFSTYPGVHVGFATAIDIAARWQAPVPSENPDSAFTLAHMFDECFLSDTEWRTNATAPYRVTRWWTEPPMRAHRPTDVPEGLTEQEKIARRDTAQRARLATAQQDPVVEAVHQARSTVLSMFLEQFVTLAENGPRPEPYAHVTDLGLVFYGKVEDLEKLARLRVEKLEKDTEGAAEVAKEGRIRVFNARDTWFDQQDPVLASGRSAVAGDGIKLDWRLQFASSDRYDFKDPEHFLHHYEITRTIEGQEFTPRTTKVKPAATIGGCEAGVVSLVRPDWQFTDDLADISAELRSALLPARDEALTLQAAVNWAEQIGENEAISVTYTVTPVDVAGTPGLPKSFLVEIGKPQAPIRPAEAELRFVVSRMGDRGQPWTAAEAPQGSVGVVIALRDPFRERDRKESDDPKAKGDPSTIRVLRNYRLIADPETIRPSGHYGTDGLTDRRLGPPTGVGPTADELVWVLNYRDKDNPNSSASGGFDEGKLLFRDIRGPDGTIPRDTDVDALEPDHDAIAKFPLWRRLAGTTIRDFDEKIQAISPPIRKFASGDEDPQGIGKANDFLKSLWRRENGNQERIATRFSLETFHTVMDYKDPRRPKLLATFTSKRTPVAIEVRVQPISPEASQQDIGLMRPEAFEWPVHLDMPAHQPGQVRAEAGFARFRAPPTGPDGSLTKLVGGANPALVRDADRRVLTQISFAASPGFDTGSATGIDEVHQTAIAGYDVHELDLDDLARLDTGKVKFDADAKAWRRARRVARVERVSPDMARLMPDHNRDWQGWQAHYPSETWRLLNRGRGRSGQSQPIRAPWYSAAESTLHFAERMPRIRLLTTAPEGAVTDLMQKGRPLALLARLVAAPNSRAEKTLLSIAPTVEAALAECEWIWTPLACSDVRNDFVFYRHRGYCEVRYHGGGHRFSPRTLREALLGFGWQASSAIAAEFMADRTALDGLALEIWGETIVNSTPIETGRCVEPVNHNTFRHPLLEEVLGELEYAATSAALYRRYVVTAQSVQPGDAKDLTGFLSATVAEKDPYGWAALQQLGLAVTLKLYDRDEDGFVLPRCLLRHVEPVMREAAERYRAALGAERSGQPFVEVLLKPGSDRVAGPFNAVLSNAGVEDEAASFKLDDDGLAMVQLSLRPQPVKFWTYHLLEMGWRQADWPSAQIAAGHPLRDGADISSGDPEIWKTVSIAGYDLCFENTGQETFEVLRAVDGRIVEVKPAASGGETVSLQVISWPKAPVFLSRLDPSLSLFFRVPRGAAFDWRTVLKVRARIVTTTAASAGGKPVAVVEEHCAFEELNRVIDEKRKEFTPTPAALTNFPATPFTAENGETPVPVDFDSPASQPAHRSPFELFGEIKAEIWSAKATREEPPATLGRGTPRRTDASVAAFESLWHNLRSALPDFSWPAKTSQGRFMQPTYADYQQVMGAYLGWSQRFIDHGAAPDEGAALPYALAAPTRAQPWHLAAGSDGMLTLSFLHADRWAHARAYAVRSTPRYQNLALGAGYFADKQDSERLVTGGLAEGDVFRKPIGYALAVSPRTERIEPPLILGSRMVARKGDDRKDIWELVVARHGEEALASSNRSLFARLGTEGTALTFAREYRDREWPERLSRAKGQDAWPEVELYPKRLVGPLGRPLGDSEIDGEALGEIADSYPSLWKGADIWRIDQLPPHYRVTALAVARAGLVVSNVVSAVQDEMPRRSLRDCDANELLDRPAIVIRRGDDRGKSVIRVEGLRLVSHADLAVQGAWPWIAADPEEAEARRDVAWWPDPNLTYSLLRRGAAAADLPSGATPMLEEEDVVVQLVARPDAQAAPDANAVPIVLRCRGPRFEPRPECKEHPAGWPEVTTREARKVLGTAKAGREFHLAFSLTPRADGLIGEQTARHVLNGGDAAQQGAVRKAFNDEAKAFAQLHAEWRLTVALGFDGLTDVAAVRKRLLDARDALLSAADAVDAPDDGPRLAHAVKAMADNLLVEANALSTAAPPPGLSRLGRDRHAMLALAEAVNLPAITAPFPLSLAMERTGAEILTVFDLPTSKEAEAVLARGRHPFGKRGGTLWRLCRERLFGAAEGFRIRAVDRRNAIEMPMGDPGTAGHAWQAVGEIDTDVTPPDWVNFTS